MDGLTNVVQAERQHAALRCGIRCGCSRNLCGWQIKKCRQVGKLQKRLLGFRTR